MNGPQPAGTWLGRFDPPSTTLSFVEIGRRYRVVTPFDDWDRDTHEVGETWVFLGSHFVPYDDGMSLYVSLDGEQEWRIPLQWTANEQGEVLDGLALREASGPPVLDCSGMVNPELTRRALMLALATIAAAEPPGRGHGARPKETLHELTVPAADVAAGEAKSYLVHGDGHSHPITVDAAAMAKLAKKGFALVRCELGGPNPHWHWVHVHAGKPVKAPVDGERPGGARARRGSGAARRTEAASA